MTANIPFDQVVVGEELGPWLIEITEEVVRQYCEDWDDPNPLYLQGTSDGGPPVAPPAFMAGLASFRLLGRKYNSRATVGAQSQHENLKPIRVGETMRTEGRIVEKYIKRGLEYVIVEYTAYNEAGEPIRNSRDHILLGLERTSQPDGRFTA
jgi:hypothetical protein